jgi:hypothetical protein
MAETQPTGLNLDNLDKLGGKSGSKVVWITARVIEGIEKAGLLKVLNNPRFAVKELLANATLNCSSSVQYRSGFYFRHYVEPIPGQGKKGCSLYIGQSGNINARYVS